MKNNINEALNEIPKDIHNNEAYCFECNITEEYGTYNSHDEWGCAIVSFGNIGAEYNFCIDGGKNLSAIYKTELNPATDCIETDTSTFIHYEIDFSNPEWKSELETAMYSFVKEKKIWDMKNYKKKLMKDIS